MKPQFEFEYYLYFQINCKFKAKILTHFVYLLLSRCLFGLSELIMLLWSKWDIPLLPIVFPDDSDWLLGMIDVVLASTVVLSNIGSGITSDSRIEGKVWVGGGSTGIGGTGDFLGRIDS